MGENTELREYFAKIGKVGEHRCNADNAYGLSICVDCLMHLANGECGSCHDDNGHDREPLNSIPNTDLVTLGTLEHSEYCRRESDGECDCENLGFSWSQCEGCGSNLGGDRYAATGWENDKVRS